MTRKEMIETIAEQAGCSKRLVRKKLFQMSVEYRRDNDRCRVNRKFNQAFLDKTTNWQDWNEVHDLWKKGELDDINTPWRIPNLFCTCFFPTGCNVILRIETDYCSAWDEKITTIDWVGTRLYNFKGAR